MFIPDSFMPSQFKNAGPPEIHFKTARPEKWALTSELPEDLKNTGSPIAVRVVSQHLLPGLFAPFLGAPWVAKITLLHYYGLIQVMKKDKISISGSNKTSSSGDHSDRTARPQALASNIRWVRPVRAWGWRTSKMKALSL